MILPQGIRTSTATVGPSEKSCQTLSSGPPSALFPWPIHHQSHCCHCPRSKIQGTHLLHYVYGIRSAMRGGQGHIQSNMPAILLLSGQERSFTSGALGLGSWPAAYLREAKSCVLHALACTDVPAHEEYFMGRLTLYTLAVRSISANKPPCRLPPARSPLPPSPSLYGCMYIQIYTYRTVYSSPWCASLH